MRCIRSRAAVALALVLFIMSVARARASGPEVPIVPGKVILRLDPMPEGLDNQFVGTPPSRFGDNDLDAIAQDLGVTAIQPVANIPRAEQLGPVDISTILEVSFAPEQDVAAAVERFANTPGVAYAQPEYDLLPLAAPNDPMFLSSEQRYLDLINARSAWDVKANGDVLVMIQDTCPDDTHPDLADRYVGPPLTCTPDFHGTAVAGIVSASTNNALGVASIGWSATGGPGSTPVQVTRWGYGYITEAIRSGAGVWNMSMVGGAGPAERELVNEALLHGIVPCVSAGNWNSNNENLFASLPGVLCVGAIHGCDANLTRTGFSAFGEAVDLTAPGEACMRTTSPYNPGCPLPGHEWFCADFAGTSASSPVVAGVAALVRALHPTWTAEELEAHLKGTANNTDANEANRCWYSLLGTGSVDAGRAMKPDGDDDPLNDYESVPSLHHEWVEILDDGSAGTSGNGNGAAEVGETVGLFVHVVDRYGATTPGSDLAATLTVAGSAATILTPSQSFPPFGAASGPNDRKTNRLPFLVTVNSATPYVPAEFRITLTDPVSAYTTTLMFNVRLNAPEERVAGAFPYVLRDGPKTLRIARTPKPVDLDGDTTPELLFADDDPTHAPSTPALQLRAYRADGTIATGWPHALTGAVNGTLAAGPMPARLGSGSLVVLAEAEKPAIEGLDRNARRVFRLELPPTANRFTPPAMGDVDGDAEVEIVSLRSGTGGAPAVYAWKAATGTPTLLPGFPIVLGGTAASDMSVALADVDDDDVKEIVAATNQTSGGRIDVIDASACVATGWPVTVPGKILRAPIAADLDGNGRLDVAVVTEAAVFAFDGCGRTLPGWPVALPWTSTVSPLYVSSLAAGDVEGNGPAEIALVIDESAVDPGCSNPCSWSSTCAPIGSPYRRQSAVLIGLNAGGAPAVRSGFPRAIATSTYGKAQYYCTDARSASPPNLTDVNRDGRLDLVFGERREVRVLEADGTDQRSGLVQGPIPLIPQVRSACTGLNGPQHGYTYFYDAVDTTTSFLATPTFVRPGLGVPSVLAFASRSRRSNLLRLGDAGRIAWNEERSDTGSTGTCPLTVAPRRPTITSVTPASFSNGSDVSLTIRGTDFSSPVDVYLGATLLPSALIDSRTLLALVPAGFTPGTYDVTLVFPRDCGCPLRVVRTAAVTVTGSGPPVAGADAWIACANDRTAKFFSLATRTVGVVSVGNTPWRVAIDPHKAFVFVANYADGTVSVIRASTRSEVDTCLTAPGVQRVTVGSEPVGIDAGEVRGKGDLIAVACFGGRLTVFDQASATGGPCVVTASVPFPQALDVRLDPTGSGLAYVSNPSSEDVGVFDLSSFPTITALPSVRVTGSGGVGRLAISADGKYLLAAGGGTPAVYRVELSSGTVRSVSLPAFIEPFTSDWTQRRSDGHAIISWGSDRFASEVTIDPFSLVRRIDLPGGEAAGGDELRPPMGLHVIGAGSANQVDLVDTVPAVPTITPVPVPGYPADVAVTNTENAPVLASITPNVRRDDCSLDVVVRGAFFQDPTFVWIGKWRCAVRYVTSTYLAVTVPAGIPDGTYDVFLENADGQSVTLAAAFTVARGTASAPEVQVNARGTGASFRSASARDAVGRTVVVWDDELSYPNGPHDVMLKVYNVDGSVLIADTIVESVQSNYLVDVAVAFDASERITVAWTQSYGTVSEWHQDIHAKWYRLDFGPTRLTVLRAESTVNQNPYRDGAGQPLYSHYPAIAANDAGNVVIVWNRAHGGGFSPLNVGRRFGPGGVDLPAGAGGCSQGWADEFCVDPAHGGWMADVAIEPDGGGASTFIVTWPNASDVWARRFRFTDASALEDRFMVNDDSTHEQNNPHVGMDDAGGFAIAWDSQGQESAPDGWAGVFAKRYDSNARPVRAPAAQQRDGVGYEFQVNESITGQQVLPDLAMDHAGRFVITWQSAPQDGWGFGSLGKRYTTDAVELPPPCGVQRFGVGNEFGLNITTLGDQQEPSVSVDSSGNFAISWDDTRQDGDWLGVFLRRFDRNGWPQ